MDIPAILNRNYVGSEWLLDGDDYAGLTWLSDSPKPTKAALEKQWTAVEYQVQLDAVAELRRAAYVIESDPLAFKYQETQDVIDRVAWLEKKDEIKARYPEPEAPVK